MKKKKLEAGIDAVLSLYEEGDNVAEVGVIIEVEGVPPEVIRAIMSRGLAECLSEADINMGYAPLQLLPAGLEVIKAGGYAGLRKKRRREGFSGSVRWVVERLLGLFGL